MPAAEVVNDSGERRRAELALVRAAKAGDESASTQLIQKYRGLVHFKARSYFIVSGDRDDIIQEGMIGLYKAIRDYDPYKQASFRSFAELCVTRQMITAVKTATRRKHSPLNSYVSLNRPATYEEDGERLLTDILAVREICDPAELLISAWEGDIIRRGLSGSLSEFEVKVLRLYIEGCSYQDIARRLDRHTKSIDNALQRIKRKVKVQLDRCSAC